jgi:hypothetical protein
VLDKGVAGSVTKTGDFMITFIVRNISDRNVTYAVFPPSNGISLYAVGNDGSKKEIYPFPHNGSPLEQVIAKRLDPGMSKTLTTTFGSKFMNLIGKKIVASIDADGDEVFSEPFTLSLPPDHRNFKVSAELDKEPKGDIPKLMVPIVLTISNESSEDAVFVSDRYDTHGVNVYSVEKSGKKILVYPPDDSAITSSIFLEVKAGKSNSVKVEMPMNILEKYKPVVFSIWTKGSNGVFLGEEIYSTPFTLPALN